MWDSVFVCIVIIGFFVDWLVNVVKVDKVYLDL